MSRIKIAEKIAAAERRLKEATDTRVISAKKYVEAIAKEREVIEKIKELRAELREVV